MPDASADQTQTPVQDLVSPGPPLAEELVRFVLDAATDGIVVADEKGRFLLFNEAAREMGGVTLTDCPPAEWSTQFGCFLPDGQTPYPADQLPLARAIRGERVDNVEMFIRNAARPEGMWFNCQARPWRDEQGRLKGGLVVFQNISEQRKTQEEIRKLNEELRHHARDQEARYRFAAKATRDAIWDWDLRTSEIEWNEGLQILFGHPVLKTSNIEWWERQIHPDDRERVLTSLRGSIQGGLSTWSAEYRFARRDGSYALVVDRGYVVRDEQGRAVRMVGAMLDITERTRAQEELARSLALLEATLDSTADGILVVDEDGAIVSFNRKFVEMWRLPESVVATRQDSEALQYALGLLKDPERFLAKVRELYAQPEAVSTDLLELTDGRVIERYSQPRRIGGGRIGRVWSFRDFTQRHRAEQSLQQEREFLRTILENLSEGIIACDAEGRLTLFNRVTREMHGPLTDSIPPEEWARHFRLYRPDGQTQLTCEEVPLYRALQGEHVRDAEVTVQPRSGGQPRSLLVSGNAITTSDGRRVGAVVVSHDITERNRLQRQLQQAQKLESIGTLAGGIAHDFNNLLAVIMGNASVLLRDKSLTGRVRESLKDIVDASERGSSLTHQLLAYARGGLQRLGPTDLNALIVSVVQMLRRTSPPQIEFVLALAPDLPPIMADPSQIEQVIMNLCLNAVQASQVPSRIEVRTRAERLDDAAAAPLEIAPSAYARMEVSDHGSGMDPATLERIFEPFFTTRFTGRGMGLAATLGIVNSHRGQIRADSQPHMGTTMTVFLPLAPEGGRPRPRAAGARRVATPGGSETVLVVEDDPAVARTVVQLLASLGYCVVSHTELGSAVAFLETNAEDVDLIILDMNLPKISSAKLFKEVQERARGAPIVLTSGIDQPQIEESASSWGAAGFLQKPFSIGMLANSVRRILDGQPP